MPHKLSSLRLAAALLLAGSVLATTACSKFERLTIVRPSAERGNWEQIAPTYDVSGKGKGKKAEPFTAAQLVASASAYYEAGRFDQAKQQAQQAIKADPASGDAHTLLAAIASRSGDSAAAGDHYRKALELSPTNGAYANNYGIWLCGTGHAQESLAWFDKALADSSYPTPATALTNAGICARQVGQLDRAEASWRQALVLDPNLTPALSGLANLQFAGGQYFDARAFVQRWLAIAPKDTSALQLAMQIEQKQGDNVAAQRYLLRLQAIPPGASTVPPTP
ncbi:type IV pilus biogenesis/stability protein PilW [Thermomonas sp.]|uniref:type IV pilus biogenesis/stability protein PilW n=1 Tax=Thermomonas sp. TaxID=1971895 RepID=UPI002488721F|nr:type IV pilus biogenesis/stability protein PilW [Thermomonas sp.]MDI1253433.1 type IV pilus biogenesis/stability protein PilW [Thermomonas sp.]